MAKLHFRYSAMNAGKSLSLLQVAHNYTEELGKSVRIFTAVIDDRYGVGKVTSRLGPLSRDADTFDAVFDFQDDYIQRGEVDCILVDEAQFLTHEQVCQLHALAQCSGVPVMCFGLRTDYQGRLFPGAASLLGLAEELEELKTLCRCGKKATMNMRVDSAGHMAINGPQIEIGGNAQYRQVCGRCFYAGRKATLVKELT